MVPVHAAEHRQAPAPGQVDVEEHHVGEALTDELDRRPGLVGLAHDLDGVAQLGPDPGPEHGVVLDQEDPGPPGAHGSPGRRGMASCTSVPSPGAERITAVPPKRATRAQMDWAMPWRSGATCSGSNPRPRSRT